MSKTKRKRYAAEFKAKVAREGGSVGSNLHRLLPKSEKNMARELLTKGRNFLLGGSSK